MEREPAESVDGVDDVEARERRDFDAFVGRTIYWSFVGFVIFAAAVTCRGDMRSMMAWSAAVVLLVRPVVMRAFGRW